MSLSTNCMLVHFTASFKGFDTQDKNETENIQNAKNAKKGAVRVRKSLLNKDALRPIKAAITAAKDTHLYFTLPYIDRGPRLLRTTLYMQYIEKMNAHKAAVTDAVNTFMLDYDIQIQKAKESLGELWNAEDYPHISKLRNAYGVEVEFMAVPETDTLNALTGLSADEINKITKSADEAANEKIKNATKSIWERCFSVVTVFKTALERDGRLHDSLIQNMSDLCDLLPALNITNDPLLDKLGTDIREQLCGTSMDSYRVDAAKRKEAAMTASKIANAMEAYF